MTDASFIDGHDIIPNDWERRTRPLSQVPANGIFMVAHHSYSRTLASIIATFKSPDRTVTANLAIGPDTAGVDDYRCIETVPIDLGRAYTTSSDIDDVALTFEMANLSLSPPYPVGQTGKEIAAQIAAWLHVTYGMPLDRLHITCHREVYARGWGSYPTACPGDDLHNALDWIVARAIEIVAHGDVIGAQMSMIYYSDPSVNGSTEKVPGTNDPIIPKGWRFLQDADGPLRPMSELESGAYNHNSATGRPTPEAVYHPDHILQIAKATGLRLWERPAKDNTPKLTGKIAYIDGETDYAKADYPRVSASLPEAVILAAVEAAVAKALAENPITVGTLELSGQFTGKAEPDGTV